MARELGRNKLTSGIVKVLWRDTKSFGTVFATTTAAATTNYNNTQNHNNTHNIFSKKNTTSTDHSNTTNQNNNISILNNNCYNNFKNLFLLFFCFRRYLGAPKTDLEMANMTVENITLDCPVYTNSSEKLIEQVTILSSFKDNITKYFCNKVDQGWPNFFACRRNLKEKIVLRAAIFLLFLMLIEIKY